ncbi:M56 family metallopeptidase [Thalassotalea litorea]|uniref:M56 family metallopeptidase n=1 Tax=Thalassotalea litorea TaxID=2020715 RepID=UPI001485205B|nr:M56 family metallopeptidase [Thalassotalea litorea]
MSDTGLNILQQLSYTLGHFLWQGIAIALALRICLIFIDKKQANLRYLCAVTALLACFVAPIYTFSQLLNANLTATSMQTLPWIQDLLHSTQNMVLSQNVSSSLQISHMLAIAWLLIVSALTVKFVLEFCWTQSVRRQQIIAPTNQLQSQFTTLIQQLQLDRKVQLLLSFRISSPMTLGFLKPVILLPAQLVTGLSKEQLELVLLHELIHIKRYDYAVNICQAIIELLLFFHPVVHWIGRQIRLERECVCDQQVLALRHDTIGYARLMTDLADYHQASSDLAIAANGGELTLRVQRMLEDKNRSSMLSSVIPVTIIVILFAAMSGLSTHSLWQSIIGTSPIAAQQQTGNNELEPIAQATIAHWLLNPEQLTPETDINLSQNVPLAEPASPLQLPENPVDVIVEQLTLTNKSKVDEQQSRQNLAAINVAEAASIFPDLTERQQVNEKIEGVKDSFSKNTASIASVSTTNTLDTLTSTDAKKPLTPVALQSANREVTPKIGRETNQITSHMTVFANKTQKQIVLPVIELQDDLSGQSQLLKSNQLIAKTYPNLQEQADIIDAQVVKSYAPKYPKLAARRKLSKAVQVSFVIDVAGRVKELDFEDDRQVRYFKGSISEAMKKWRFKPATINGKPIESSMTKIFDFNLDG